MQSAITFRSLTVVVDGQILFEVNIQLQLEGNTEITFIFLLRLLKTRFEPIWLKFIISRKW